MELLIEVGKQVPALVVLAWVVRAVLNHIQAMQQKYLEHEKARDARLTEAMRRIGDDCRAVQQESIEIMQETKQELGASREITKELLAYLRKLNGRARLTAEEKL